jgi:hypothetical protein
MQDAPRPTADPDAAAAASSERRLLLVAGAGRSGTSTVAGILRRLGLHVPQPEVVGDETNPRGFGESQWVVDFHDDLLHHARVQVSDARPVAWERTGGFAERPGAHGKLGAWLGSQLEESPRLLVKDPRLAWFLPLWESVSHQHAAVPAYLTMLRPPAEVVGSKRTYYNDRLQDAHGAAAWLNMMVGTERATRGAPRTFVRYHDLLDGWEATIGSALADLRLGPPRLDPELTSDIDGFVDPGLRRIQLTWDDLDLPERLASLARDAWTALDALAADPTDAGATAELDRVGEAYDSYYRECEEVSRSSAIAARSPRRPASPRPAPADRPASPPAVARGSVARAIGRRTPRLLRRLVPERVRERLRA